MKAAFTEQCVQSFNRYFNSISSLHSNHLFSQGITLGSMRGGLITIKSGVFKVICSEVILEISNARHVGSDGSFPFGEPVWVGELPDVQSKLLSMIASRGII